MENLVPLPPEFYVGDTREVARRLLGCLLVCESPAGIAGGRIVETEAYLVGDPANHSFRGRTARNAPMWGAPGRAYVYLTYGMHYCFNAVTAPEGVPEAVLVRALEPLIGIDLMQARRPGATLRTLTSGPARLTAALGIGPEHNGTDLARGPVRILAPNGMPSPPPGPILAAPRIGVHAAQEEFWRYFLAESPYVSRRDRRARPV